MRSLGIGILLAFLASTKLLVSIEGVQSFKWSRKPNLFNSKQLLSNYGNVSASPRQTIIIGPAAHSSNKELESSSPTPSSDDPKGSEKKVRIPQINFYNSLPNSVGTTANGVLWLRELSAAMSTPLPLIIGIGPIVIFGVFLLFWPDLTNLGLPLFYPNGAEGDPLSAFPPYPDWDKVDISNFESIKTAIKKFWLIPPDWF